MNSSNSACLHYELVCTCNYAEIVLSIKFGADVRTKCVSTAARRCSPPVTIVRVGPKEIADVSFVPIKTLVGHNKGYPANFHYAIKFTDLIERSDGG